MGNDIVRRSEKGKPTGSDIVRQNETDLSAVQAIAIKALVGGATVSAAAEQAGVGRQTVHRWLATDAQFLATHNSLKREMLQGVRAELRSLSSAAVAVLRDVLVTDKLAPRSAKLKCAFAVLKMVGVDSPESIGSSDPDTVQDEMDDGALIRRLTRISVPRVQ